MNRPLHVAHVVLSLDVGGLERIVLDLVREGMALGSRVTVVCVEREGVLAHDARSLGARVVSIGKPPGLRPKTYERLRAVFRELQSNVVHTHQVTALFYAGRAARRAGVPLVVHTEHGKHYAARFLTRMQGRLAARNARRFFCVSDDLAKEVERCRIVPKDKIFVVRNGIETARFAKSAERTELRRSLSFPHAAAVIGTVGRLSDVKRQDVLLRGFAQVRKVMPEARLLLVGDGPMRGSLEALAIELGIGSSVHFAGYQADPQRFLQAMDAFALTSRSEGMPLAVLEAWAAGVPVIASRVGGLPEMIEKGKTGLLFDFPDAGQLAKGLVRILCEPGLAAGLRETARQHVQTRFDSRVMAEQYAAHYRELLGA